MKLNHSVHVTGISSLLNKNDTRNSFFLRKKKKNAQANLKSNHILYSSGNINICLANLTSHSVINVPIVLQEQTTLEFSFFQCAKKEPFEK